VPTRELIKAEIDRVEDESLDELYGLVKRFTNGGPARGETDTAATPGPPGIERPSALYIGSPRLVHREQAADFAKEVVEDRDHAGV
jgi:hypothetical protein